MASTIKCDTIQSTTANVFFQNSSGTEYARFDSGGNLGIGTSSPLAKLHVYTGSYTDTSLFVNNSYTGSTGGIQITQKSTGEGQLFTFNAQPLLFGTSNTERMRLYADGRLSVNGNSTYDAGTTVSIGGGSTNVRATSAQLAIGRTTVSTQYEGINFNTGPSRACFIGRPPNSDDLIIGWDAGSALSEGLRFPSPGGGIKFPATQVASADVNTLDDYEEGTWTPSVGGTATYSQQGGTYTKIGRVVYISFILQIATIGTGSSNTITGIPFAASGGWRNTMALSYWNTTNGALAYFTVYVGAGTSDMRCVATTGAATGVSDAYGALISGTYIMGSGCYITA